MHDLSGLRHEPGVAQGRADPPLDRAKPRPRGLTGTGRRGAEDSSAPGDKSAGLRATETAWWRRFGTTVSNAAGQSAPHPGRSRSRSPLRNTGAGQCPAPRGLESVGHAAVHRVHSRSIPAGHTVPPNQRHRARAQGRSDRCRARRGTVLGEAPVTRSTPQLKLK